MRKSNRKGFTIVELVIVIAVIAILAAVLIPTFASIIKKANMSADQQAVRQMNTFLASEGAVEKPESISEARIILLEADIEMKDYKPLTKDMYFYWVKSENRIIYADKDNKVIFPAEYEDLEYKMGDWFSLSGIIVESNKWKENISNNAVTLSNGSEFASFMEAYNNKDSKASGVTTITLKNDIDLMGSATNFKEIGKNLTIDGAGKTIYGLCSNESASNKPNAAGAASSYSYGLLGKIAKGTVTIKNVTIDGAVIDDPENSAQVAMAGVIAGSVYGDATLVVEDVTISNCYVRAEKKAGAIVAYVSGKNATVKLDGVKVSDTVVTGGREIAALVGFLHKGTLEGVNTVTKKNVTVELDESYDLKYTSDKKIMIDTGKNNVTEGKAAVTTKDCWVCNGATKYAYDTTSKTFDTNAGPVATDFSGATGGKLTGMQ